MRTWTRIYPSRHTVTIYIMNYGPWKKDESLSINYQLQRYGLRLSRNAGPSRKLLPHLILLHLPLSCACLSQPTSQLRHAPLRLESLSDDISLRTVWCSATQIRLASYVLPMNNFTYHASKPRRLVPIYVVWRPCISGTTERGCGAKVIQILTVLLRLLYWHVLCPSKPRCVH